ncbi:MAG: hypothetical protein IPM76_21565 [Chloroflexi bacterium]|nr:hypothetical protein [Chloroflexota bacterium]
MNFQPIKFTFVTIAAILLSIGFILNISVSWSHNSTSLQLLKALDIERSIADNYENLYLKPSHSLTDLETKLKNPCQSLWYSRLVALFDLTVAKQYLVYSQACSRQNLIQRWQGLISWRLGEKEDAFNYWSVFAPSLLVDWGRSLVLADEAVLGQSLLQAVETQNPEMVLDLQYQIKLYETLGNLSLQSGDETKAIFYYLKVWEYSGSRYDNAAYHLGQSYAVQGQCQPLIFGKSVEQ